jgi:hypothetical protein
LSTPKPFVENLERYSLLPTTSASGPERHLPQALRAIVLAAVHEMARTQEHTGDGDAQSWTNELSATCQDGAWVIVIMVAAIRWCRGHSERASAERELAGTMAMAKTA